MNHLDLLELQKGKSIQEFWCKTFTQADKNLKWRWFKKSTFMQIQKHPKKGDPRITAISIHPGDKILKYKVHCL